MQPGSRDDCFQAAGLRVCRVRRSARGKVCVTQLLGLVSLVLVHGIVALTAGVVAFIELVLLGRFL